MKLLIEELPLKRLLLLFKPTDNIDLLELGDTNHPSSGFVDESILGEIKTVGQLIDIDYDFPGLIYFKASIASLTIQYADDQFSLIGERKHLEKIVSKAKALKAGLASPQYQYQWVQA